MLLLGSGVSGIPTDDIGFLGERGSEDNVGFIWDESHKEFACVSSENTSEVICNNNAVSFENTSDNFDLSRYQR